MSGTKYELAPVDPPPSYENTTHSAQSLPAVKSPPPRAPLPLDLPLLRDLRSRRVILASASPRRKQLFAQIGLHPTVIPCTLPEAFSKQLSPIEYVLQTATQKCMHIYESQIDNPPSAGGEPALVVAADTVVVAPSGQILEKPRSEAQHISMLTSLRNARQHKVYTAVVAMAPLSSARDPGYALESTVKRRRTREGADKAGGYAVQGAGALLVERIDGGFDNVVGLPLRGTLKVIERVMEKGEEEDLDDEYGSVEEEGNIGDSL